jgi:hypothetical protein
VDDKFITVATFGNAIEAEMAHNLLDTEGIPSLVLGTELTTAFGAAGSMGDQISLQVRETDAQRAAGLLAAAAEATLDDN